VSRLDEEYDKAEHHDLKRVDERLSVTQTRVDHIAVCWCNWVDPDPRSNFAAAYQAHDRHRDEETGARP
jgi:hypothetical protein